MAKLCRIAPTPSGYLHHGNLFSFALTWLMAKKDGLSILLRIDDLDQARYRSSFLEDIFRSLEALGIDYDMGPQGVEDFEKNWSQQKRLDLYNQALEQLKDHDKLFACDCSRKEIILQSPGGTYPKTCLNKGKSFADPNIAWRWKKSQQKVLLKPWRQTPPQENSFSPSMAYPVLRTKDGRPAYQMASLMDDLHFGVSHIVRGADLLDSSFVQLGLAEELKEQDFKSIHFHHHPLVLDGKEKLSKSKAAPAAEIYRDKAALKDLLNSLSDYLHLPKGQGNLMDLLEAYRVA